MTTHGPLKPTAVRVRHGRRRVLESPVAYLFVLPALTVFTVFTIIPTVFTFLVSTFDWNYLNPVMSTFVGPGNYAAMGDMNRTPSFASTMWTSFKFSSAMVIGGTVVSLALAVLVSKATRLLVAVRSAMFLAYVAPLVATSLVWAWMYNTRFGLANGLLQALGLPPLDWLGDPRTALPALIAYSLWHELGFLTVVFVGGLTTMSKELSEAAKVDGANAWQEFVHVTLPQLRPFVVFVVVISSVSSLQAFTQFYVLTNGGPGDATATIGFQLYQEAFVVRNTGYAAALAVVLFLLTAGLSLLQLTASKSLTRTAP